MILRPQDLPRRLPADAPPLILVMGNEPLFVREAADAARGQLRAQGFEERLRFDGLDEDAIFAESQAGSLFATRKILEVDCPEAKIGTAGARFIKQWLSQPPADICLLLVAHCERMPKLAAWMKQVGDQAVLIRCDALDTTAIAPWLKQRSQGLGLRLSAQAVDWMALRTEGALLAAAQDLDKLAMLGMEGEIDQPTLEAAVADSARFDVFALPEACLAGDLPRARRIAERLQAEGAPTPLLNFALARDLRSLVQLSRGKSPQAAGVWGWRSSLFEQAKRRLNGRTLLRLYFAMASLDRAAKSRPESVYWEELLNFVHVFAGPASAQRLPLAIHEHTEPC